MSDADHEDYLAAFEVYTDDAGEWRWRLLARNGNILADSAEGYSSKMNALNGVDTVRSVARDARIDVERTNGEPVPDGGESIGGDKPDDYTPPRQREHYWVECRYCGEETYDLERRCVHCGNDRQAHREPEHRDPDRRRMADGDPITDVDLVPVDEDVVEAGYPVGTLNQAILSSQERFRTGLTEWGEGDNWTDANPRELAVAVNRNARDAALAFVDGHHAEARQEIGDALNYLLFLRNLISVREGGDSG